MGDKAAEKSKEPVSPSKRRKDKTIKKSNSLVEVTRKVIKGIIAEGGPPSEITDEKIINKAVKILGGGAEFKGGGRAVMKKGGKV